MREKKNLWGTKKSVWTSITYILCDQRYGTITSVKKFSGALAGSKCLCCYLDCPKTKNSDMKTGTILCTGPRIGTRSEFKTKTIVSRLPYIIYVTYLLTEKRGQKSPFTDISKNFHRKEKGGRKLPPFLDNSYVTLIQLTLTNWRFSFISPRDHTSTYVRKEIKKKADLCQQIIICYIK
jgi:hypothetical protein